MIAYLVKGYVVKCLSFRFTNDLGTPINHLGTPILTVNFLNALKLRFGTITQIKRLEEIG